MTPELIGIHYSPWTEKARWALDHHRIPYRYSEHLILLGMPSLRWKTRKPFRDLTVPILLNGKEMVMDSFEIAQHVDSQGQAERLFPEGKLEIIRECNKLSEDALDAGRALLLDRMSRSDQAKFENLPPLLRKDWMKPLAPALLPMVSLGLWYVRTEFSADRKTLQEHEAALRQTLSKIREKRKGEYALEDFSYADVVLLAAIQAISPVSDRYIRLKPATRACWTHPGLAQEFQDLVAWRDRLYEKHRRKP